MLNRSALVLRSEQPFINWVNGADPTPERAISLDAANENPTVYLVDEIDGEGELEASLHAHHQGLFERELHAWCTNAALWPTDRSLTRLRKWCCIQLHSVIPVLGQLPRLDDGLDN